MTTTLLLPRARSLSGIRPGALALGVDAVRADLMVAGNDVAPGTVFNVAGGSRSGDATDKISEAVGWSGPVGVDECLARHLARGERTLGWGQ